MTKGHLVFYNGTLMIAFWVSAFLIHAAAVHVDSHVVNGSVTATVTLKRDANVDNETLLQTAKGPAIHFFSYGSGKFAVAAHRIRAEAQRTGLFDQVHVFDTLPRHLEQDPRWSQHLSQTRGAGYWFWKSAILLHLFRTTLSYGDVLVYVDSGCELGNTSAWEELLVHLCSYDLIAFVLEHPETSWTKGDVWRRFGVAFTDKPYALEQMVGGYQVLRKTPHTEQFLKYWELLVSDLDLVSDKPSKYKNPEGFREHRHDQSLLSMLVKSNSPTIAHASSRSKDWLHRTWEMNPQWGIKGLRILVLPDLGWPPNVDRYPFAASRNSGKRQGSARHLRQIKPQQLMEIKRTLSACAAG